MQWGSFMAEVKRPVTERDFRRPEFLDAKPEDYEFRADGALVRKDRWERGIYSIVSILGINVRNFEIDEVVAKVRELQARIATEATDQSIEDDLP